MISDYLPFLIKYRTRLALGTGDLLGENFELKYSQQVREDRVSS